MRLARPLIIPLVALVLAACSSAAPGWTYAPAPSVTPIPSTDASAGASGEPSQGPSGPVVQISAKDIKFSTAEMTAPADTPFQIEFQNDDNGVPHNIEIKDGTDTVAFNGDIFSGVDKMDYAVPALVAGTYKFLCSVHPQMSGSLTVQ
jgi:plastocyanin